MCHMVWKVAGESVLEEGRPEAWGKIRTSQQAGRQTAVRSTSGRNFCPLWELRTWRGRFSGALVESESSGFPMSFPCQLPEPLEVIFQWGSGSVACGLTKQLAIVEVFHTHHNRALSLVLSWCLASCVVVVGRTNEQMNE